MKCPLLSAYILGDKGMEFKVGNCLHRDCVAWDQEEKRCRYFNPIYRVRSTPRLITVAFMRRVLRLVEDGKTQEAITLLSQEMARVKAGESG